MESINNSLQNDEKKNRKTRETTSKKRTSSSIGSKKLTHKKAVKDTTITQESVQDAQKPVNMQNDIFDSINLKKVESNTSEEIIYESDTQQNELSKTRQHSFFKDLWYSIKGYFSQ